jgi:hypothetical protein
LAGTSRIPKSLEKLIEYCIDLWVKIYNSVQKLHKLSQEFKENKYGFTKNSVDYIVHVAQYVAVQEGIRRALIDWESCACDRLIPVKLVDQVWKWATQSWGNVVNWFASWWPEALIILGIIGTIIWWVGKIGSPFCGPAIPVCAVLL